MSEPVQVAVVGVGHLGQHHARIFHEMESTRLVGVVDVDSERGRKIASDFHTRYCSSMKELPDSLQAVSIVTPTVNHLESALEALRRDCHVFVEKPITHTVEEAETLVRRAEEQGKLLQVGHIERFNSAVIELRKHLREPRFVESHRLGPPVPRVKDIGVVKDLMIHDLDLILSLLDSEVKSVEAVGVPVLTPFEDIANARLHFKNGCIANLTVSRVTPERMRKIRFFQSDAYLSLDYQQQTLQVYRKVLPPEGGTPRIDCKVHQMEKGDALHRELEAFIEAIQKRTRPVVTGQDGLRALALAEEISRQIHQRL